MERDRLHAYYERELAYLRHQASRFAKDHPMVASRLGLQADVLEECPDPHVERLIESFAFLSGRLRKKLDDDLPELSETLLNVLFPHLLSPIPSMGIAEMQPMEGQGRFDTVYKMPRDTQMVTHQVDGKVCRFRSCYGVDIWPMRINGAALEIPPSRTGRFSSTAGMPVSAVRLKMKTLNTVRFSDLSVERLRLHFGGEDRVAHELYDLFINHLAGIEVLREPNGPALLSLEEDAVEPVGFAPDESLFPFPPNVFPGYRLLMEYFSFHKKFLFVDIRGLERIKGSALDDEMELVFHFRRTPEKGIEPSAADFRLGCTPIVNLFDMRAEPIDADHKRYEYPVIPVRGQKGRHSVYSINRVKAMSPGSSAAREILPVYSYRLIPDACHPDLFWNVSRASSEAVEDDRTVISFVDHGLRPNPSERLTVVLDLTCTNGNEPLTWPFGSDPARGDFTVEELPPQIRILCASRPSPSISVHREGDLHWKLISHLSLNHLSISEGSGEALKALLSLYDFKNSSSTRKIIDGLIGMKSRQVNRLVGRNLASGLEIEVVLNASAFDANSSVLFCEVLNRFLGLYASINSFIQLVVKKVHRGKDSEETESEVRTWSPRTGQQQLG